MNLRIIFLSILAASTLGCSGNHVVTSSGACITCFNNPVTGKAINHDNDIDYSKAKSELKVPTESFIIESMTLPYVAKIRINNGLGIGEPIKIYDSEAWERSQISPTGAYSLSGTIKFKQYDNIYINIVITNLDHESSKILVNYANLGNAVSAPITLENSLELEIRKLLNRQPKAVSGQNYKL